MRILCLATEAYGGGGGIAQACRDVIEAMARQDLVERIDIVVRYSANEVKGLPAKVHQHDAKAGRVAYGLAAVSLAARSLPDLVYCNHLHMAPLAMAVAKLTGARLMIQLHGIEIWPEPSWVHRRALEAADILLCVSRDTRKRVLDHIDLAPERALVVNNTVNPGFNPGDRAAARAKLGFGQETIILTVGRLDPLEQYKGHDRVLAALPNLREIGLDVLYVIAGEGGDRPRLEALARTHKIERWVRFVGQATYAGLLDLYRAADLFALPSTGEGFGIVFLEAMACGTPAIGLRVGGAPDALADGEIGRCVASDEFPVALARVLQMPPPDPKALSMAVETRFGISQFHDRIAQILKVILVPTARSSK